MTTRFALMVVGIVASVLVADAQTRAPEQPPTAAITFIDPVAGLTLDEAIARALDREPALKAARTQVDVARGMRVQAGLRPNPSLSVSQQQEPAGSDNQTRVEVQWPLDLFRNAGRVAVADREIDVARQTTADRERTLAVDVRLKYGEAAAAVRSLTITDELLTATSRQRTLVAARVDQGAAPPIDRDMLRVEVQRLDADRLLQSGDVERRMIELKRLLGMRPEESLTLRESLEPLVMRDRAPAATEDSGAVATRPDVQAAEARVGVADAQIDRARREGRTDVSLFAMYMRMDQGFPQRGFTAAGDLERVRGVFHYASGGAMVMLPIRNRNEGAIAAAEAERVGAAAQLDASRLTAQSEITAARARGLQARRALEAYTGDAIALARQNLDVVRQTYELGRGTLLDVLNEQRRYLDLERAYTAVLREAYDAAQALKQALGETR
jgi:cobalt-zinc-cadmium efflux system outer membrane protein